MKKMKKIAIFAASIVAFIIIGMILLVNKLDADVEVILTEPISEMNLENVEDGIYVGEYNKAIAVNAVVEVTIIDHRITQIVILEHHNGQGDAAEVITTTIIEEQSLLVDDIAGATYSSRVLKLAVYKALEGE